MIPAEAVEAARKVAYERYGSKPDAAYLQAILKAAAPHMLEHFANRIDWRCADCEEPIAPDAALKKLREDTP